MMTDKRCCSVDGGDTQTNTEHYKHAILKNDDNENSGTNRNQKKSR